MNNGIDLTTFFGLGFFLLNWFALGLANKGCLGSVSLLASCSGMTTIICLGLLVNQYKETDD
jgi:hypothetical protein